MSDNKIGIIIIKNYKELLHTEKFLVKKCGLKWCNKKDNRLLMNEIIHEDEERLTEDGIYILYIHGYLMWNYNRTVRKLDEYKSITGNELLSMTSEEQSNILSDLFRTTVLVD
jgi:hypothetical protein